MNNEPLVNRGLAGGLVAAVIAVLVSFGLPVSDSQTNAILGLIAVASPIVVALWARTHVTPVKK